MLLEHLLQNLALSVEPFATCATAPGWRLSFPGWDQVTFHFVIAGEGVLTEPSGRAQTLGPNTLAIVPAQSPHAIEVGEVGETGERLDSTEAPMIPSDPPHLHAGPPDAPDALNVACGRIQVTYGSSFGLFDRLDEILVLDFSDSPQMRAVFAGLMSEQQADRPGREAMIASLMNQCLVLVFRHLSGDEGLDLPWIEAIEDPRWAPILELILEQPEQPHTVESLSRSANMSRSAFARAFRERFGTTPMSYVREVRLRRAARLLLDPAELSIAAVAHRVGFESRSQFSRAFHQLFGCPPTVFRVQGS